MGGLPLAPGAGLSRPSCPHRRADAGGDTITGRQFLPPGRRSWAQSPRCLVATLAIGWPAVIRKRETAARRAAFAEQFEKQCYSFQRGMLFELQDELKLLARAMWKALDHDRKTLGAQGGLRLLPDGMSDEILRAMIAVRRLKTRVLDVTVRDAATRFQSSCAEASLQPAMILSEGRLADDVHRWVDRNSEPWLMRTRKLPNCSVSGRDTRWRRSAAGFCGRFAVRCPGNVARPAEHVLRA